MHYFGIPGHNHSMMTYMILTEYFFEIPAKNCIVGMLLTCPITKVVQYFLVYRISLYKSLLVCKRPSFERQSETRCKFLRAASLEVLVMACKGLLYWDLHHPSHMIQNRLSYKSVEIYY